MLSTRFGIPTAVLAAALLLTAAPARAGTLYSYSIDPFDQNIGDVRSDSDPQSVYLDTGLYKTAPNAGGLFGNGRAVARADSGSVGVYAYQDNANAFGLSSGNAIDAAATFRLDDVVVTGPGATALAALNLILDGTLYGEAGRQGVENASQSSSGIFVQAILAGSTYNGGATVTARHVEGRYSNPGTSVTGVDSGLLLGVLPSTIGSLSGSGRPASYSVGLSTPVTTPFVVVPVGTPFTIQFTIRTWTTSGSGGGIGYAATGFLNSLSFPSGAVLSLPAGFSASSASFGDLSGPAAAVPLPAGLPLGLSGLALLGLLSRRRRR